MSQGGQVAFKADDDVIAASKARDLEQHVRELERTQEYRLRSR